MKLHLLTQVPTDDREWEVLLDVTLAEFLKSHTGSLSVKGVLNIRCVISGQV